MILFTIIMVGKELGVDNRNIDGEVYDAQKREFLSSRRWLENNCAQCNRTFHSKTQISLCGDFQCSGSLDFLIDSRKFKLVSPVELNLAFTKYFTEKGFKRVGARPILNQGGTTMFTSAGVQVLEQMLLGEQDPDFDPLVISQPSLRTQYLDILGEGTSLSFVNIATQRVNPTPEEHMETFDQWLAFFSKMGLYIGDITLVEKDKNDQWGDVDLIRKMIKIFYKGLEIGDANFNHNITGANPKVQSISDIGVGLERLTWVLGKGSYFDHLAPLTTTLTGRVVDVSEVTKALTLLSASGLQPSNKDSGYRYRMFSKSLVAKTFPEYMNLASLTDYYYDYWSNFNNPGCGLEEAKRNIQTEYDRNYNAAISSRLPVKADINQRTNDFLSGLLKTGTERKVLSGIMTNNG